MSRYTDVDSGGEYLVMSSKPFGRPPSEMTDTMMASSSSSATTSGAYRQSQHRPSKQTSTQYARQHSRPRSGANVAASAAATGGVSSASTNWEYHMIPTTADCEGTTTVVLLFDYDVSTVEVEMQTTKDVPVDSVDQCNGEHTTKLHTSRVTDRAFTFTAPERPEGSADVLVTVDGRTTVRRSLTYQSGALRLARGLTALYVRLLEAVCQFALTRQPTMSGGLLPGIVGMLPGAVPSNPIGDLDQLLATALADTDADVPAYIYEDLFGVYRMHNAPAPMPAAGRGKVKSMVIGGSSSDDVIATPTLLHLAARRGMVTFIDRLVDLPDSSVAIAVCRDRDGRKAGDLARRAGHIPLADRLDKLAIEGAAAMRVSKKQTDGIVITPSSQITVVPSRTSRRSVATSSDRSTKASSRHSRESNASSTKQDQQLIVDDVYVEPEVVGSGIGAVAATVNTRIADNNNGPQEPVRTGHRRKVSRDELVVAPVQRQVTLSTQVTDDAEYIDSDDLPPPSFRPPPPPSAATRRTNMQTTTAERKARAPSAPSLDVDDAPPPVAPRSASRNAPTPNRTTTLPVRPQPAVRTKLLDSGKNCASVDMASPPEATAELDQLVPAPKPAARPKTNQV